MSSTALMLDLPTDIDSTVRLALSEDVGSGDVTAVWGNVQKAANLLGWKSTRSLEDALTDAWRWEQHLKAQTS